MRQLCPLPLPSLTAKIHQPWSGHDTQVLIVAVIGIVVALIGWLKIHAFVALNSDPRCLIGLGGPDVEIALLGLQIYDYYEPTHRDANDSF